jgi:tRNA(fMet)-specific endonuclease VapC
LILDTDALSALAEGEAALETVLHRAAQVLLPVIVLGEYRYGIGLSRERAHYEQWLAEYLSTFRVLEIDERTSGFYAAVRTQLKKAGTPIPSNDVWIAALCRQHSLPLLSRDLHFDAVAGITRIAW